MPATDGVSGSEKPASERIVPAGSAASAPSLARDTGPHGAALVEVEVDGSRAVLEQTDYGHPGRFNPPQLRRVSAALASREAQLQALVPGACGLGELAALRSAVLPTASTFRGRRGS